MDFSKATYAVMASFLYDHTSRRDQEIAALLKETCAEYEDQLDTNIMPTDQVVTLLVTAKENTPLHLSLANSLLHKVGRQLNELDDVTVQDNVLCNTFADFVQHAFVLHVPHPDDLPQEAWTRICTTLRTVFCQAMPSTIVEYKEDDQGFTCYGKIIAAGESGDVRFFNAAKALQMAEANCVTSGFGLVLSFPGDENFCNYYTLFRMPAQGTG